MTTVDGISVRGLDHIVLISSDVERSLAWYCEVLGLAGERVEEWRAGTVPFPSVRISSTTIIDIFAGDRGEKNLDHLCLMIEPTDLGELARRGDLQVVSGPGPRWGAQGEGQSLYVLDPDGNTVELRHYGGAQ